MITETPDTQHDLAEQHNWQSRARQAIKIGLLLVTLYVLGMGYMYCFQRNFVFMASNVNPFNADYRPFRAMTYQTPLGLNLRGLYVPAQNGRPTIVYFQGSAGTLTDRFYKAKPFIAQGYGFFFVGYPGYNGNPGAKTEKSFYTTGISAIKRLTLEGVPVNRMVLYGESIGTGVATQMALDFPSARGLVLEAPFTSLVDLAKQTYWFFPVEQMLFDRFDNAHKIGGVRMPVLIFHGTKDKTVPYHLGRDLFGSVRSPVKAFVTIQDAGHTDLYKFGAGESVNAFLARL